jgi:WD40 repeat protein
MNLIVSGGLDTLMNIWYMDTLMGKSSHCGHNKAIIQLEWLESNRLILSAGLDHDISIWNPLVNERIFTLKGHSYSLIGVKWLKGTN